MYLYAVSEEALEYTISLLCRRRQRDTHCRGLRVRLELCLSCRLQHARHLPLLPPCVVKLWDAGRSAYTMTVAVATKLERVTDEKRLFALRRHKGQVLCFE